MESNGLKGKIHCSEATANALIAKGKESWLIAREDKVHAKGKGEMQTYFVHPTGFSGRESLRSSMTASDTASKGPSVDIPASLGVAGMMDVAADPHQVEEQFHNHIDV